MEDGDLTPQDCPSICIYFLSLCLVLVFVFVLCFCLRIRICFGFVDTHIVHTG